MSHTSFKKMREEVKKFASLGSLVNSWYDGTREELFSHEQRYMLARLYFRAHRELQARGKTLA